MNAMGKIRAGILLALLLTGSSAAGAAGGYVGISVKYEEEPSRREGRMEIVTIYPESPAAKAGLAVGDVVTRVNGVAFRFPDWTATVLAGGPFNWAAPGDPIELQVERAGRSLRFALVAVAPPARIAEEKRLFLEGVRKQTAVALIDRLARGNAIVTVEVPPPGGALRATADGLDEAEIAALSRHFSDPRLTGLFSRARPGDRVRLQLGLHPGTEDPSITLLSPPQQP